MTKKRDVNKLADTIFAEAMRGAGASASPNLSQRQNPGVTALALALPNPAGAGSFPPDIDALRRSEEAPMAKKKKLSAAQQANLAYGRAVRANMLRANPLTQSATLRKIAKARAEAEAENALGKTKDGKPVVVDAPIFQGGAGNMTAGQIKKLERLIARNEKLATKLEERAARDGVPAEVAARLQQSARRKRQPYAVQRFLPQIDPVTGRPVAGAAEPYFGVQIPKGVLQQLALERLPDQKIPVSIIGDNAALTEALTKAAREAIGNEIIIQSAGPSFPKGSKRITGVKVTRDPKNRNKPLVIHGDNIVEPADVVYVERTRSAIDRIDKKDLASLSANMQAHLKTIADTNRKIAKEIAAERAKPKEKRARFLPNEVMGGDLTIEAANPLHGLSPREAMIWLNAKGFFRKSNKKGEKGTLTNDGVRFVQRLGLPASATPEQVAAAGIAGPKSWSIQVSAAGTRKLRGARVSEKNQIRYGARAGEAERWADSGVGPARSVASLAGLPGISIFRKKQLPAHSAAILSFLEANKNDKTMKLGASRAFYLHKEHGAARRELAAEVLSALGSPMRDSFEARAAEAAAAEAAAAAAPAAKGRGKRKNMLRANWSMGRSELSMEGVQADLRASANLKGVGLGALAGIGGFVANTVLSNVVHGMVGEKAGAYVRYGVPAALGYVLYRGALGADRLSQGQRALAIAGVLASTFAHDMVRGFLVKIPVVGGLIGSALNAGAKGMSGFGEDVDPFDAAFDDDLSGMGQIYAESGAAGVGDSDLRYVRERGTNGLGLYVAEQGAQAPGAPMEGMGQLYAVSVDGLGEDAPPGTVPITRSEPEPSELPEFSQQNISMLTSRGVFGDPVFDSAYNPFSGQAAPALPEQGD